jgi:hypothetical protein
MQDLAAAGLVPPAPAQVQAAARDER